MLNKQKISLFQVCVVRKAWVGKFSLFLFFGLLYQSLTKNSKIFFSTVLFSAGSIFSLSKASDLDFLKGWI